MSIKTNISKDQQKELKTVLSKLKVPSSVIEELLSSQVATNTYKSFRQGKKITSKDGGWTIHFGAKWAKETEDIKKDLRHPKLAVKKAILPDAVEMPSIDDELVPDSPLIQVDMPELGKSEETTIKKKTSRFAKAEEVMVSFHIDRDALKEMQQVAAKQGVNVNVLFKLAIKQFLY